MDKLIPISSLQSKAKKYVEQVHETDEPLIITQRGRAAAVLVNYETYEGHVLTMDEMKYPDWKERLARADKEHREGKSITLEAFLRKKARRPRHASSKAKKAA
jgi:prevent-host-death family protein